MHANGRVDMPKLKTVCPLELLFLPRMPADFVKIDTLPDGQEKNLRMNYPHFFEESDVFTVVKPGQHQVIAALCQKYIDRYRYHISFAITSPEWRNRGIMDWAFNQSLLHSLGFDTVQCDVKWSDLYAQNFWGNRGLRNTGGPGTVKGHDLFEMKIPKGLAYQKFLQFGNDGKHMRLFPTPGNNVIKDDNGIA